MCDLCHLANLSIETVAARLEDRASSLTESDLAHIDELIARLLKMELKNEDSELARLWETGK